MAALIISFAIFFFICWPSFHMITNFVIIRFPLLLFHTILASSTKPPTCTQGYVDCVNGFVRSTNITCAAECGGNCCVGSGACEFFTGKVCKDGSCNGLEACRSAQIPAVVSSCQLDQACASVAAKGGRAGNFVDSCKGGTRSCAELGFGKGGAVQEIDGSCKATSACQGVGATESSYAWKVTGPVHSDMIGCCNSASACSLRNETTLPTTCKVSSFEAGARCLPS